MTRLMHSSNNWRTSVLQYNRQENSNEVTGTIQTYMLVFENERYYP